MDFQHVYKLHNLLSKRRTPLSLNDILHTLEIKKATFHRIRSFMIDSLNAPIKNDRGIGYYYDKSNNQNYELPGLWFSAQELIALSLFNQMIETLQPLLVKQLLQPVKEKTEHLMAMQGIKPTDWQQRLKILPQWQRPYNTDNFHKIINALFQRKQLKINYKNRQNNNISTRTISPQQLIYYRDNWYLDCWCHMREELRTFSIDAIEAIKNIPSPAKNINQNDLTTYYSASYGIFSGQPIANAIIEFSKQAIPWVSKEQWHPKQQNTWMENGNLRITIPYSDSRELIKDIMNYGANAEVIAPKELRQQVKQQLQAALEKYI